MSFEIHPITLRIREKLTETESRNRKVKVNAESITLGTQEICDVELRNFSGRFSIEIKFADQKWWVVNLSRFLEIRLNGKRIESESELNNGDLLLLAEHQVSISVEKEILELKRKDFEFSFAPMSDAELFQYLLDERQFDEVLINGKDQVFVDWQGQLLRSPWKFESSEFLLKTIFQNTKRSSGWFSWSLNRDLRIHGALPPVVDRPHICIRKLKTGIFSLDELSRNGSATEEQISFLKTAIKARDSILVSGATSTGKTVLLRALLEQAAESERVIVIEEEPEIAWNHPHQVLIESGRGGLEQSVIECLRMRPDRLVISEIRGPEAFHFIQAISTGHLGSMSSIHAKNPREALSRLESLALSREANLSEISIRRQIASSIQIIVQLHRDPNGRRRIESISRVTGIQKDTILLSDPILFENSGISSKIVGIADREKPAK